MGDNVDRGRRVWEARDEAGYSCPPVLAVWEVRVRLYVVVMGAAATMLSALPSRWRASRASFLARSVGVLVLSFVLLAPAVPAVAVTPSMDVTPGQTVTVPASSGWEVILDVCGQIGTIGPTGSSYTIVPFGSFSGTDPDSPINPAGNLVINIPPDVHPGVVIVASWTSFHDGCFSAHGGVTLTVVAPTPAPGAGGGGTPAPGAGGAPTPAPGAGGGGTAGDRCPAATRTLSRMRSLQQQASIARGEAVRLFAAAERSNAEAADRFGATALQHLKEAISGLPQGGAELLSALGSGQLASPALTEWTKRLVGGGYRQNQLRKLFEDFFHATRPTVHGVPSTQAQRALNYRVEKQLAALLVKLVAPVQRAGATLAAGTVVVSGVAAKAVPYIAGGILLDAYIYYFDGLRYLYDGRQQSALADRLTQEANAAQALARRQALACSAAQAGSASSAALLSSVPRDVRAVTAAARTAATPAYRRLPAVRPLPITLRAATPARSAAQRLLVHEARALAYVDAGAEALRRSITAGRRGEAAAEQRQLTFARRSMRTASTLLGQVSQLRNLCADALRRAGVAPFDVQVPPEVGAAAMSALGVPPFVRTLAPPSSRSSLTARTTGASAISIDPSRIAGSDALQRNAEWGTRLRALAGDHRETLVPALAVELPSTARRSQSLRFPTAVIPDGAKLTIVWKRAGATPISQDATVAHGRIAARAPGRAGRYVVSVTHGKQRIARRTVQVR